MISLLWHTKIFVPEQPHPFILYLYVWLGVVGGMGSGGMVGGGGGGGINIFSHDFLPNFCKIGSFLLMCSLPASLWESTKVDVNRFANVGAPVELSVSKSQN